MESSAANASATDCLHSKRECANLQAPKAKLLKKDLFGSSFLVHDEDGATVRRDASDAAFIVRWLARRLLAREARALLLLAGLKGVPELLSMTTDALVREYIDGAPMQESKPNRVAYFHAASALLRQMHRRGVVHNDLAKEPNLLVGVDGQPAIIDFQLAWVAKRRNKLFRMLGREDIRHLLKHKRTYCPERLTARECHILEHPSVLSRLFMVTVKPVYLFITRRLLGWQDREGAGDRR
jgi:predicted Ser/Thr protein kinase